MNSTRLFRILICALVICSLLINCSPIRAKAVAVEASIAIGLIAMMILASAGVVYTANTTSQIQAIGNSFQTHMYQWGTSAEKLDEVDAFFNGLHLYVSGSGDDDDTPHDKQVRLARGILAGIALWVGSLALGNIEIKDEATASEGYTYYNGYLLPTIPGTANPRQAIVRLVDGQIWCLSQYYGRVVVYGSYFLIGSSNDFYSVLQDNVWGGYTRGYIEKEQGMFADGAAIIWANYDIADANGNIVFFASEPSSSQDELITPSIYVGDIPDQLQSGELEPEAIPLPDINLEPYIEDGKLAPQKVIDTMSNLSTGALPYDQFLQQSTLPPEIDDGTDSDSGTSSDTWQPPSNPGQFALDLTKYFPFCIPFDLYDLFTCLNADPVAPVIHWELPMPGGSTYPIELDLSPFNSVAQLLRRMQLLLFCVGLAIKTRDLIKG